MSSLTFPNILTSTFIFYVVFLSVPTKAHEGQQIQAVIPQVAPCKPPASQEFLDAHNRIRENMGEPPLRWDGNVAKYAKHWAEVLSADCNMVHSSGPYGENLFWGANDHWTPAQVVQSWIKESEYFDDKEHHCKQGQMCEHYTQVIWKKTCRIGCARRKCAKGGLIVVCNYDPPGNYENINPLDDTFQP